MIIEVPTRTITEVSGEEDLNFNIFCSVSMNDDGTSTPVIYRSKVLDEPTVVDGVGGIEGELMISSDERNAAVINRGDLVITLENDDPDKYSVDTSEGDLLYEE